MAHVTKLTPATIVDPTSGRTYPIPMGGADDGDTGDSDTGDSGAEGATPGDTGDSDTPPKDDDKDSKGDDGDGAGSKRAVLEDLAKERAEKKALKAQLAALTKQHETDAERTQREADDREATIRTEAQAPAINALRAAAIETAARDAGFVDPGDASMFLRDGGTIDSIVVDLTDASLDRKVVEKLIAELATRKPHLVTPAKRPGAERGGSDTNGVGADSSSNDSTNDRFLAAVRAKLASAG